MSMTWKEAVVERCLVKKVFLKIWKHLCQSLFFNKVAGLPNWNRTSAGLQLYLKIDPQVFSYEFSEMFNPIQDGDSKNAPYQFP